MADVKIRMIGKVSGTRNGAQWPEPGGVAEVSEDEAIGLIAGGVAVPYRKDDTFEDTVAASGAKIITTSQSEQAKTKRGALQAAMFQTADDVEPMEQAAAELAAANDPDAEPVAPAAPSGELTNKQLIGMLEQRGIAVPKKVNKQNLIDALKGAVS